VSAKELPLDPGERFLGGSGVILFKGLKKKPRKPGILLPTPPSKSSWCHKRMSFFAGVYQLPLPKK
jgi:hypothetical protein